MRERADQILQLLNADPARAVSEGVDLLAVASDSATRSVLARAVGAALRAQRKPQRALPYLRDAVREAEQSSDTRLLGLARLSLALGEAYTGETTVALELINSAEPLLAGLDLAELVFQRGLIHQLCGRLHDALRDLHVAIPTFCTEGHAEWEADGRYNRAVLHGYLGDIEAATADLDRCAEIFAALDDPLGVAFVLHNRAWLLRLDGQIVECLAAYAAAEELLAAQDFPVETAFADRCEALLTAGLKTEALQVARGASAALRDRDMLLEFAECQVMVARAAILCGHPAEAAAALAAARSEFDRQQKPGWILACKLHELRNELSSGAVSLTVLERAEDLALELSMHPVAEWKSQADLVAMRLGTQLGRNAGANVRLAALRAQQLPLHLEAELWLGAAELRRSQGDASGAMRAVRAGLRRVAIARQVAVAPELWAALSRHQTGLLELGVDLAAQRRQPRTIHSLAEEVEATEDRARQVPLSSGANELQVHLTRLRGLEQAIREGEIKLTDTNQLLIERRELERLIADHRRKDLGTPGLSKRSGGSVKMRPDISARRYLSVGDRVLATDLVSNRSRQVPLGSRTELETLCRKLMLALRANFRGDLGPTAGQIMRNHAAAIDQALGRPGEVGAGILNIIPATWAGWVPWGLLPSLADRPWQVVRSLQGRTPKVPPLQRVLLVTGANLAHDDSEVRTVAKTYPGAEVLGAPEATSDALLTAMDGADLVHVSAHIRVSADNPMFSSLELTDGPLSLHSFDALRVPPATMVLASCQAARQVAVGTTFLGVADYLAILGVKRILSPGCHIPDDSDTTVVMTHVHEMFQENASLPELLHAARTSTTLSVRQRLIAGCLVPFQARPS